MKCIQVPGAASAYSVAVSVGPNDGAGHLVTDDHPPVSWTLSPPLTCVGTPPCGFLVLTVGACIDPQDPSCPDVTGDPVTVIASAGPSITVPLAAGAYRFDVELHNPDGTRVADRNGKVYPPAHKVFTVDGSCTALPPVTDGGSSHRDAATDAATHRDGAVVPPTDGGKVPVPDAATPMDASTPADAAPHDAGTAVPDARVDSGMPITDSAPAVQP